MPHKNLQFTILFFILYILHCTSYVSPALAQTSQSSLDIAGVYDVADPEAVDGDILITTTDKGIIRATTPLDSRLFGVLQIQSIVVYRRFDNSGKPVIRNGVTKVNVTTLNGPIGVGDYITSSEIAGKGQKGSGAGYVLGVALNSFSDKDGSLSDYIPQGAKQSQKIASGQIMMALKIEYAEVTKSRSTSRMFDSFNSALFTNIKDPDKFMQIFKYIAAGMAVLASFGIGFLTFSRSVPKGIEAIGRNPLAEKAILFSIILNVIFTIIAAGAGVAAAALILRL